MAREGEESNGSVYVADDLVSIVELTDHSILNCLRERYRDDQIYVSCYRSDMGLTHGGLCK